MQNEAARQGREWLSSALVAVAKGDEAALRKVYDATSAKLFGVCLRICKDREAAEDVLQLVYIKIWNRAGRFEAQRASPISWLCAIARNTAIDWVRANGTVHLAQDAAAAVADTSPLAPDMIEMTQQRARIFECLEALDERPRNAIRAAFFDGLTYAQLADAMTVPLGTLKSWVRRGLIQLRGCVDDA